MNLILVKYLEKQINELASELNDNDLTTNLYPEGISYFKGRLAAYKDVIDTMKSIEDLEKSKFV